MNCARPHKKVMTKDAGMPCARIFFTAHARKWVCFSGASSHGALGASYLKRCAPRGISHTVLAHSQSVWETAKRSRAKLNDGWIAFLAPWSQIAKILQVLPNDFIFFNFKSSFMQGARLNYLIAFNIFCIIIKYFLLLRNRSRIAQSITSESWRGVFHSCVFSIKIIIYSFHNLIRDKSSV